MGVEVKGGNSLSKTVQRSSSVKTWTPEQSIVSREACHIINGLGISGSGRLFIFDIIGSPGPLKLS